MDTVLQTYPAHGIHRRFAQLVCEIVSLDKPDAVFARHGALHLHGSFDHAVDHALGHLLFAVVEQDDS